MKKKKRINPQKVFCFISLVFIITCCLWYGGRFIYFYLDSKKEVTKEITISEQLKKENHNKETFVKSNKDYYFYKNAENNYLTYSNLLWRIIKINNNNSILLILDKPITNLAFGTEKEYENSNIIKWLNKESSDNHSGILENKLNNITSFLIKNKTCIDIIDNTNNITCKKTSKENYFGLLSLEEYIKTGGKNSFINDEYITYLSNKTKDNEIWILDNSSLDKSEGNDILSIKPTITLSPTVTIKSGNGTKEQPYIIEDNPGIFASYVKLDQDIWRVYDYNEEYIKLSFTDYIKDTKNNVLEHIYSNNTYKHNDTISGSIAYYLNHTFLNSLNYKNIIENSNYYNGYYDENNDYNIKDLFEKTIDTKVSQQIIGDAILTPTLNNYFFATGTYQNSNSVFVLQKDGTAIAKKVTNKANIVPCITIKRNLLTKGKGTKEEPYTTE